ncbi:TRM11 family SAM-dependent methyltransferase [Kribbella sp. NPDC004138]
MRMIRSIRQTSVTTVECAVDGPFDELADCGLFSTAAADRGQVVAGIGQRLGRPERLPWSTNLIVAEVLVRLAKIRPGDRVLDPFCGTGTMLRAVRRREPCASVVGTDHDPRALVIAARNGAHGSLALAAATALPLAPRTVDRVVANLPFGKQVGSHRANRILYPAALEEIARVLTTDGRAVVLTEDKRLLRAAIEQQKALKLVRDRLLRYNGAAPTAYVLTRTRRSRTSRTRFTTQRRSP